MDLKQFIVRAEVLSLMRKALRVASRAPPSEIIELKVEVRRSFEVSRHLSDRNTIKHLLSDGRLQVKALREMFWMST